MSKKPKPSVRERLTPFVAPFRFDGKGEFHLKSYTTGARGGLEKDEGEKILDANRKRLSDLQERLYAQDSWSLLLIFQGMDASGKDSAIKSIFEGVNPQGCEVTSFKQPTSHELDHDFMWRAMIALPERGRIGIFNRSYYEECLVTRVHHDLLAKEKIPRKLISPNIWNERFADIGAFERYLSRNGTVVLKFFLNISKKKQRERFLDRLGAALEELEVFHERRDGARVLAAVHGRLSGHHPAYVDATCALARGAGRSQVVRARGDRLGHRQCTRRPQLALSAGRQCLESGVRQGSPGVGERRRKPPGRARPGG